LSSPTGVQHLPVSSHLKSSPSLLVAKRTDPPTSNVHPEKSTSRGARRSWFINEILSDSYSANVTDPRNFSGSSPCSVTVSFNRVLRFFHIRNLSNASVDEAMFLHLLHGSLITQARTLAAVYPGSLRRSLQVLLAAMREPGKSYTKQSAVRKRPSNSPAPLRKRLSGA
jgi:hypothetical protein